MKAVIYSVFWSSDRYVFSQRHNMREDMSDPNPSRLTLGLQVKHRIIFIHCLQKQCPRFHLCCCCTTDLDLNKGTMSQVRQTELKNSLPFPHHWYVLRVGIQVGNLLLKASQCTTHAINQRQIPNKNDAFCTPICVALLSLILNVCPTFNFALPLKCCEWAFWHVLSITVKCRTSTEPQGKGLVCWVFCQWEFLLHARQSNPAHRGHQRRGEFWLWSLFGK